jgi:hypothetical protein
MKMKMTVSLASAALLSLSSGVAQAASPRAGVTVETVDRNYEPVNYRRCPGKYVCLWQNRDATGRRIQFKKYGTYKLSNWSMTGKKGASSFYNHQCCGAHATLIGPSFRLNLATWGNIPQSMNDRATYLKLSP